YISRVESASVVAHCHGSRTASDRVAYANLASESVLARIRERLLCNAENDGLNIRREANLTLGFNANCHAVCLHMLLSQSLESCGEADIVEDRRSETVCQRPSGVQGPASDRPHPGQRHGRVVAAVSQ